MNLIETWRAAIGNPETVKQALIALALFKSWCATRMPNVPGMATGDRLAIRINRGMTVEQAAAREYVYRWYLAVKDFDQCEGNASSIFGAPHTIGM